MWLMTLLWFLMFIHYWNQHKEKIRHFQKSLQHWRMLRVWLLFIGIFYHHVSGHKELLFEQHFVNFQDDLSAKTTKLLNTQLSFNYIVIWRIWIVWYITYCKVKNYHKSFMRKCDFKLVLWLSKERRYCRFNCATFRYHGFSVHLRISSFLSMRFS